MKKVMLLIPPLFFFLVLTISPVLAIQPIETNVSIPTNFGSNFIDGLECTNITGTLYCYSLMVNYPSNGDYTIVRVNATLQEKKYCKFGSYIGSPENFFLVNTTHVGYIHGSAYYIIDISSIASSTTCTATNLAGIKPAYTGQAGFYYKTDNSSFLYFGSDGYLHNGDVRNSSTGVNDTNIGTWADVLTTPLYSIRFPDETDNTTAYGINTIWNSWYSTFNQSHIYSLSNGNITTEYTNPFIIYGISPTLNYAYLLDFFKENASMIL